MRVVVSVCEGDIPAGVEPAEAADERRHLREAARALAELAGSHQLVVTYGAAPHLELLLEWETHCWTEQPFDVVTAESEAAGGYLLAQELTNALSHRKVAALLTQVGVDPSDHEFRAPTWPVGPVYDKAEARALAAARGWLLQPVEGGWRRVVPAPEPHRVVEADTISLLLDAGVVVVCGGGGGIPVVADFSGRLRGVAAVVPAEASAAVLAAELGAERLVLLTGDGIAPAGAPERLTVEVARRMAEGGGPGAVLLRAACRFTESTGHSAGIGPLRYARAVLDGDQGIVVGRRA